MSHDKKDGPHGHGHGMPPMGPGGFGGFGGMFSAVPAGMPGPGLDPSVDFLPGGESGCAHDEIMRRLGLPPVPEGLHFTPEGQDVEQGGHYIRSTAQPLHEPVALSVEKIFTGVAESRFNEAYYCQIFNVKVDGNEVVVDFEVNGDNSLGPLQNPANSRLIVNEKGSSAEFEVKASRGVYTTEDPKSSFAGQLIFSRDSFPGTGPEPSATFECKFEFGQACYSQTDVLFTVTL